MGYINKAQLRELGAQIPNNAYGKYLLNISDKIFKSIIKIYYLKIY